jgi:hypothetical protein
MKKYISILFLFYCFTVSSQIAKKSLIGKWQLTTEASSNGGGKIYSTKIKNGAVLIFDSNKGVIFKGVKGTYDLESDRLILKIKGKQENYMINITKRVLSLNPLDSDFHLVCDEGCAAIYTRMK